VVPAEHSDSDAAEKSSRGQRGGGGCCRGLGLARLAADRACDGGGRRARRPARRGAARPPGRPGDLERLPARLGLETAGEAATPRRAFGTSLTTTVFNPLTIALWTIRRQRTGQGRNRPQARTCSSCLAIAACCSSLCRWKCSGTVSGRVSKGRCPAINAGRPRVREPEAGPSRREAGHARCLRAPFRQRAAVRAARSPAAGLPREPRLAEGGEVDDRAADEGRGDLERALAGGDRGEDVGVGG